MTAGAEHRTPALSPVSQFGDSCLPVPSLGSRPGELGPDGAFCSDCHLVTRPLPGQGGTSRCHQCPVPGVSHWGHRHHHHHCHCHPPAVGMMDHPREQEGRGGWSSTMVGFVPVTPSPGGPPGQGSPLCDLGLLCGDGGLSHPGAPGQNHRPEHEALTQH